MKDLIYADNAATTKLDRDAFEAMKPYLLSEFGNPSQKYSFSWSTKKALKESRERIAGCIGAVPEEIFFTSGGTESDNWAIKNIGAGRGIITSAFEHHAILNSCETLKRQNREITYLCPTREGKVTPDALEETISTNTALVSVMSGNNEIGTIQPIKELCRVAHRYDVPFHTDAVQAVGHIPMDVGDLGVDMLSASAHKFHGPRGIGFLYVHKGTNCHPFMEGGSQEFGLRAGTENVPAIVGMATALQKCCQNMEETMAHIQGIEHRLLSKMRECGIDFVRNGGPDTLPGIVSLSFKDRDGEALMHRLDLMGIAVSTGSACDSQNTEISHVLRAIKLEEELAKGTIRISFGRHNSLDDADAIAEALRRILL